MKKVCLKWYQNIWVVSRRMKKILLIPFSKIVGRTQPFGKTGDEA
jgi:hypothetical protein